MLKINHDLEGALKVFLVLLDKEAYFEAHEVLEEAWHPLRLSDHPLKNLVKGLINAAIAFEHIKRNRENMPAKVNKVIASYERYKGLCRKDISHAVLFEEAKEKVEALKQKYQNIFTTF
ncbi:MAG: hypothetical protein RLZZ428_819 [Pseudomonadota bacterium]|jgi:predicted metal-dependent hydrolase